MPDHLLQVPNVVRKTRKVNGRHGWGKKRALCHKCQSLKDNRDFYLVWLTPHPSSHFVFFYEGFHVYCCKDCLPKYQEMFMPKREYWRLFKVNSKKEFENA